MTRVLALLACIVLAALVALALGLPVAYLPLLALGAAAVVRWEVER